MLALSPKMELSMSHAKTTCGCSCLHSHSEGGARFPSNGAPSCARFSTLKSLKTELASRKEAESIESGELDEMVVDDRENNVWLLREL